MDRQEARAALSALIALVVGVGVGVGVGTALDYPAVMVGLLSGCVCVALLWASSPWRAQGRPNRAGEGFLAEITRQWSRPPG